MIMILLNLSKTTNDNEQLFFGLAIKDIQQAADLFKGIYNEGKKRCRWLCKPGSISVFSFRYRRHR
jgi:hypothetical protein